MTGQRGELGDGGGRVVRISAGNEDGPVFTHGPVKETSRLHAFEVVTFYGSEESDVLHAAGSWMAEHPFTMIVSLNWRWDHPDEDQSCWLLDLTVDHEPGVNRTEEWRRAAGGDPRLHGESPG